MSIAEQFIICHAKPCPTLNAPMYEHSSHIADYTAAVEVELQKGGIFSLSVRRVDRPNYYKNLFMTKMPNNTDIAGRHPLLSEDIGYKSQKPLTAQKIGSEDFESKF
jgi:hypothetical protein